MIRSATIVGLLLGLLSPVVAQERHASIRLEDGRALEGRVLSMDLKELVIRVGDKVLLVPATEIRSCRFREPEASGAPDVAAAAAPDGTAAVPQGASGKETSPQGQGAAAKPAKPAVVAPAERLAGAAPAGARPVDPPAAPGGETAPPATSTPSAAGAGDAGGTAAEEAATAESGGDRSVSVVSEAGEDAPAHPRITWDGPLEDPVIEEPRKGLAPHWMPRLRKLDAAYPWLRPAQPSQWISLGLLLLVGMGLIVHFSVRIAGAERVLIERSILLGVWYVLTGLGQIALVPVNDLSVTLMLLANTTLSLFLTCALFGLHRFGATVALLVQLGFGVLIFGVLELVSALLSTVGVTPGVTS